DPGPRPVAPAAPDPLAGLQTPPPREAAAPAAPDPLAGLHAPSPRAPRIPGFRILGKLGAGGMGTVYRARQESMGREVALKVLSRRMTRDPSYVERFLREARAAARLNHPNVVRTFDAGNAGDLYYHVMELV